MQELFFETKDSEVAIPLRYFEMVLERPFTLHKAMPCKIEGLFFCKHNELVGEAGHCGKVCPNYTPRNGKNGACIHYSKTLFEVGEPVNFNTNNQ